MFLVAEVASIIVYAAAAAAADDDDDDDDGSVHVVDSMAFGVKTIIGM